MNPPTDCSQVNDSLTSANNGVSSYPTLSKNPGRVVPADGCDQAEMCFNHLTSGNKINATLDSTGNNIDSGTGSSPQLHSQGSSPQPTALTNPPHGGNGPAPHHINSPLVVPDSTPSNHLQNQPLTSPPPLVLDSMSCNQHQDQPVTFQLPKENSFSSVTSLPEFISGDFDAQLCANLDVQKITAHYQRVATMWPTLAKQAAADFPDFAKLYTTIKSKNIPNFLGARITLTSRLNLKKWEEKLCHYHDKEICQYLRFGWPVG